MEDSFKEILEVFDPNSMEEILKQNIFFVPPNQRAYSWTKDKWQELFEDIKEVFEERRNELPKMRDKFHFFGPMFFIPEEGKLKILDGQQRLATTTLLLKLLHDILNELLYKKNLSEKGGNMMGRIDQCLRKTKENSTSNRILLGLETSNIYEFLLRSTEDPFEKGSLQRARNKYEKNILRCYKFFLNEIISFFYKKEEMEQEEKKVNKKTLEKLLIKRDFEKFLLEFSTSVMEGLYVLIVQVPSTEIGYEIFETLNQRGEKLLTIDLFKNLLFERFGGIVEIKDIESFWEEFFNISNQDEKIMKSFLRHFWISKYKFIREKKLFISVKDKIDGIPRNKEAFNELKEDITKEATIYSSLLDSENDLWARNNELRDLIQEINYLGFTQQLPLFLAAFNKCFPDNKSLFKKLLKTFLNLAVKKFTILGGNPNELEEDYGKWALKVRGGELTVEEIIQILKSIIPDKSNIATSFGGLKLGDRSAKYVLCKLNDVISNELQSSWKNNPTLEHVIPKKPNEWWKEKIKEKNIVLGEILNRVGNLTILCPSENEGVGNKEYIIKKQRYLETKLPLNEVTFKDLEDFGEGQIDEREFRLSKIFSAHDPWEL